MKLSPEDKKLSEKLGPSKFSGDGFIGKDPRNPDEIMNEDKQFLEKRNISIDIVADILDSVYKTAAESLGRPVQVSENITAEYHESMGKIPSPFTGEGLFPKGEVIIKDSLSGKEIILTPLSIHLIKKHCFFQGKGSRYRIEPEDVIILFRIN